MDKSQTNSIMVLGEMAVKQRLVTPDQLKICLAEQAALRKAGRNVPLGQIFIKRHLLTAEQVREILLGQKGITNSSHLVNGKYALVRKLGQGGAGEVYLARDTSLDRPVAIKILREEMTPNKKAVERFVREAKVLARIRHPNIVSVHETGRYQGRHYFIMDYVDGKPLDIFNKKSSHPLKRRIELLCKISEAAGEVHRHGVVHRDLKPSNILISEEGNPFLLDFGLARDGSRVTKLTVSGTILGTPYYMAPEQVEGKSVDSRTDVYALGVLLYEATAGRLPFRADNDFELYRKISSHDPPTPSTINRRVPRDLEIICLKAMDKDPSRRYANGDELASDLQRYLEGLPIVARRLSLPVRILRRAKDHKILGSGIAGSLLVGFIALGFILTSHLRESSRIEKELHQGDSYFSEGRLVEAKESYNRVRGLDPDNRAAEDGLDKIHERQGHIESRLAEAARVLDQDPLQAGKIYAAVIELDQRNSTAREGMKRAQTHEENLKARRRNSDFLSAMHERIMKFESAYTLPPDDYLLRDRTIPLREDLSSLRRATTHFESDQKAEALYLMGRIQSHLGDEGGALESLGKAIETMPHGRYYYQRGILALARYRDEFMRIFAQVLPSESRAALLEKLTPLRNQASEDFIKAVDSGSVELWQARFAHAVLSYTDLRYEAARRECETIIQSHLQAEILKLLGQIALDQAIREPSRYEDAIDWFKKATNIYRSDHEAYAGLATAYYHQALVLPSHTFKVESLERAVKPFNTAIRLREETSFLLSRGMVRLAIGEWLQMTGKDSDDPNDLAFLDFRAARDRAPGDPSMHNWLGMALIQSATGRIFSTDPRRDMDEAKQKIKDALVAMDESIRLDSANGNFYHTRAVAYGLKCFLEINGGRNPALAIRKAQKDIATAIELGNRSAAIHEAKGLTHLWKCIYLLSEFSPSSGSASNMGHALTELDRAISSCTDAIDLHTRKPDLAKTIAMRGILQTMKGLYGFFLGRKEECVKTMQAASEDFGRAGDLVGAYRIYDSEAFVNIRKAMELQLQRKDPTEEYKRAKVGFTKLLEGNLPNDKNAYVLRHFCLLYRGFANYYLDLPREAIDDWNTLINAVPPFGSLLQLWLNMAEKKLAEK